MKSYKILSKSVAVLIMIVMCFTLFSVSTAAVSLDKKGSVSITVVDRESKEVIKGAVFRIYQIASAYTVGDSIAYTYLDEFKDNGMNMGNFSDAYLPVHLKIYAEINHIPYTEKVSDNSGKIVFDNLPCGAYLIVPVEIEEGYLNPTPFIVTVPMKDETNDQWIYNIDATPKTEIEKDDTDEKIYISVKKYWESNGKIPDNITVSLVKDGVIVDTVILSAVNNWYHKWEDLDKNHSWNVIETKVPQGYTASYVTSQMTVIITNTVDDYEEETTTSPDETTTTTDETTTTTDDTTVTDDKSTTGNDTTKPTGTTKPTSTTNTTEVTESTTKPEELIDTGQLNWPVPVFAITGMLLFSLGWAMINFEKKDEEAV